MSDDQIRKAKGLEFREFENYADGKQSAPPVGRWRRSRRAGSNRCL
jgi:hypothetical protein